MPYSAAVTETLWPVSDTELRAGRASDLERDRFQLRQLCEHHVRLVPAYHLAEEFRLDRALSERTEDGVAPLYQRILGFAGQLRRLGDGVLDALSERFRLVGARVRAS